MSTRANPTESVLLELTAIPTAAGHEDRVQAYLDRWLKKRARSVTWKRDKLGNLLIRRATKNRKPPILITAHLDHPAFVVRSVEGRTLTMEFRGGVMPPYFDNARIEIFDDDDCAHNARITSLNTETKPFKTVEAQLTRTSETIAPGHIGRWKLPKPSISGGRLRTHACDDLAAVGAALLAFDRIRKRKGTEHVGLLFTVAEEVGFIGAIEAAKNGLIPKRSRLICLENSRSFPESPIGGGAIVRVGDRMSIFDPDLTNQISDLCLEEHKRDPNFTWQRKLMPGGACEATAFGTYGYQSTCLCLPLGNYHNMSDIDRVQAGKGPAKVQREEIAISDAESLIRMLILIATQLDAHRSSARSRLDALHKNTLPALAP